MAKGSRSLATIFTPLNLPAPSRDAAAKPERVNPLLLAGDVARDLKTIGDLLGGLHLDKVSYHGTLQALLSATKRMEAAFAAMIEDSEVS